MKKKWIIPLIIGIVVVSIGIILLASGISTKPPEFKFGQEYDPSRLGAANAKKMFFIIFGIFIIFAGIILSTSLYFTISHTSAVKSRIGTIQETVMKQIFQVTEEKPQEKEKEPIYCQYCGAKLDENDKKCPGCGAIITKGSNKN